MKENAFIYTMDKQTTQSFSSLEHLNKKFLMLGSTRLEYMRSYN